MTAPFLKWVGGKRALLDQFEYLFPSAAMLVDRHYVEPFIGGGAVFFKLADRIGQTVNGDVRRYAFLNDSNRDLMLCYMDVRDSVQTVIDNLAQLEVLFEEDPENTYYNVRESFNLGGIGIGDCAGSSRSAALIFLNKTCFNGIWRVNKTGGFNVPMGRFKTPPVICDRERLLAASMALVNTHANICAQDFREFWCGFEQRRVFMYLDPPYDGTFDSYTKDGFDEQDQRDLAQKCRELDGAGGLFMASNADTPLIRKLYEGFDIKIVTQQVSVNSDSTGRGKIGDLVIRNYK